MDTKDKRNSPFPKDPGNPNTSDRNTVMNEELYDLNTERTQSSNAEDAERGYTVRDGHNPNKPNPDEKINGYDDDDLDDLNDDFHNDRDLEDTDDDVYEVVLEEGEEFDDEFDDEEEYIEEDLDDEVENDEFDNPADTFENDFNETEDVLEDIDDDEDYENNNYVEDDVQRPKKKNKFTKEDQRRFY
ncbi:hypothetical protein HYN56_15190 [Flavobacterium crocinum]|uniref:Uncharacterized protein n=1 Tax=Flavobacterium crocinum TaxID=2183896 RepID=A0A2S1YN18_9FLAO|nr:hypothetical protein [Flavobacterium crocinum]AWK05510.1 hypothetical protein HYN56_15190 [Flavobacterium crocinum]